MKIENTGNNNNNNTTLPVRLYESYFHKTSFWQGPNYTTRRGSFLNPFPHTDREAVLGQKLAGIHFAQGGNLL